MKIIVTGSLGNISKPLTEALIQKGHEVSVISSSAERRPIIQSIGAQAVIGSIEDSDFLTETFKGADIAYCMEALAYESFFDHKLDFIGANIAIGQNYKQAIERSGVKKVVHLSSIGAHMPKGNGILTFHYEIEKLLNELPNDISIKFMRPTGFYYNMFQFIQSIKSHGAIVQNYGGDEKEPWVSPLDIADVIAEEIERPFEGRMVRYIASDEISPNEVAQILGVAIGQEHLKWQVISDEQHLSGMLATGMNPQTAKGFIEMNTARRGGILYEDYYRNRPVLGRVKIKDFARDFAAVYNKQ